MKYAINETTDRITELEGDAALEHAGLILLEEAKIALTQVMAGLHLSPAALDDLLAD